MEAPGCAELRDADCRKCAAVRRDYHIRGTRHLVVMHISREADCARLGHPADVRCAGVRHGVPNGHPGRDLRHGHRRDRCRGHRPGQNSGLDGRYRCGRDSFA
jgi:hypothetical protein